MNYKIILKDPKAEFEDCSISEIHVWNEYNTDSRSLILYMALVPGQMNYEDVENVQTIFKKEDNSETWIEVPPLSEEKYGVHRTHCCVIHGCKYGDLECPVEKGIIKQDYPCESCNAGDEHKLFGRGDSVDRDYLFYD